MTTKERVRPIVVVNFDLYNPPHKAVNKEIRDGGPLIWFRWQTNGHRDADILDLPDSERWFWIVLLGLAGKERRLANGNRVVRMSSTQLAREAHLNEKQVEHALRHLWDRKRIRYTTSGGDAVVRRHRKGGDGVAEDHPEGGAAPPDRHPEGGHRRTYVPTDPQTDVPRAHAREGTKNGSQRLAGATRLGAALEVIVANAKANVLTEAQELVS